MNHRECRFDLLCRKRRKSHPDSYRVVNRSWKLLSGNSLRSGVIANNN
jgi:hypothetical protein